MSKAPEYCKVCSIILREGDLHLDKDECIKSLQSAMIQQKEAASNLGMDLSVKFLKVLEGLAQEESQYTGILEKYQKMGDWSPMVQLRERLYNAEVQVRQLLWIVKQLLAREEAGAPNMVPELERLARDGIEALTQLRIRPLDPRL